MAANTRVACLPALLPTGALRAGCLRNPSRYAVTTAGRSSCRAPTESSWRSPNQAQRASFVLRAAGEEAYQGMFGEWKVEEEDIREVLTYRIGISVATAALLTASATTFLPDSSGLHDALVSVLDPVTGLGIAGLGTSLLLVHIYVAPLKRFLQLLWAFGSVGTFAIMATQSEPAAQYVLHHPISVLAVGPLFAAATGLAFKEGMCYGKFEAAGLFFVIPSLLLGHMFSILPAQGEQGLLAAFCILASVFASRKYTQPIKDDIGDKSVFEFQALSEEEQQRRMKELNMNTEE